jgi:aerobic C4-dicarboxylate transport protein
MSAFVFVAWRFCPEIDKFTSECRALTNLIGNGLVTVMLARGEGERNRKALSAGFEQEY